MPIDIKEAFKQIADDKRFIKDIREIAISKLFYEDTSNFFNIVPGIKGGQQVAALKGIEYVTRKSQGCGGNALSPKFPAISQFWEPQLAEVKIKYCYDEFMGYFTQWGLNNGYKIKDLEETELVLFIQELIVDAMKQDMQRLVLFGDENIAAQDVLADANKAQFYDVVKKGLIPTLQYFKTIGELEENFVTLDKNTGNSQFDLEKDYALNVFEEVVDVDDFDGNITLTSNKLFKNYKNFFKLLAGVGVESSKREIQDGIQRLKVDNEELTPIKNYDRWRKNDFQKDDGAGNLVTHLPHFAIHTKKEHLQVGVDDTASLENLTLEYIGGDQEEFFIKGNYMIDFKMANPFEFKAAI